MEIVWTWMAVGEKQAKVRGGKTIIRINWMNKIYFQ